MRKNPSKYIFMCKHFSVAFDFEDVHPVLYFVPALIGGWVGGGRYKAPRDLSLWPELK